MNRLIDLFDEYPGFTLLALVALFAGGIMFGAYKADSYSCKAAWQDSGMPQRFSLMGGCQVQYHGAWIPSDNYRAIQ